MDAGAAARSEAKPRFWTPMKIGIAAAVAVVIVIAIVLAVYFFVLRYQFVANIEGGNTLVYKSGARPKKGDTLKSTQLEPGTSVTAIDLDKITISKPALVQDAVDVTFEIAADSGKVAPQTEENADDNETEDESETEDDSEADEE